MKQTKRNGKFVSEATVYCVCLCLCGCMPGVQIHEDERNERRKKCTRKRPLFVHSRDNKMCNKNNHEHGDECESESEKEMGKEVNNKQHRFWLKLFYDLVRVHFWRILFEFFSSNTLLALREGVCMRRVGNCFLRFLPAQCSRIHGLNAYYLRQLNPAYSRKCVHLISNGRAFTLVAATKCESRFMELHSTFAAAATSQCLGVNKRSVHFD